MPRNNDDDYIYQYPEASQAKRKETELYLSRDDLWAMNYLGRIKGVDYQYNKYRYQNQYTYSQGDITVPTVSAY